MKAKFTIRPKAGDVFTISGQKYVFVEVNRDRFNRRYWKCVFERVKKKKK